MRQKKTKGSMEQRRSNSINIF